MVWHVLARCAVLVRSPVQSTTPATQAAVAEPALHPAAVVLEFVLPPVVFVQGLVLQIAAAVAVVTLFTTGALPAQPGHSAV